MKNQTSGNAAGDLHLSDHLAAVPGVLMCFMVLLMLLMDVTMPGMFEKQFQDFPALFRVLNCVSVAAGIAYLAVLAYRKELGLHIPHKLTDRDKTHRAGSRNPTSSETDRDKTHRAGLRTPSSSETEHAHSHSLLQPEIFFVIFLICIALSTAVNGLGDEAVHGISYRNIGVFHMLAFVAIYMGVSSRIRRESLKDMILLMYSAAADLTALAVLYDRFVTEIPAFSGKKELSAIFFNGNHYGYFMVMAISIGVAYYLFAKGWRAAAGGATAALNLAVLAMNHSLGCILAVFVIIIAAALLAFRGGKGTAVSEPQNPGTEKRAPERNAASTPASGKGSGKDQYRNPERNRLYYDFDSRKRALWMVAALVTVFAAGIMISPDLRKEFTVMFKDLAAIFSNTAEGSVGHNRLKVWRLTAEYISERPLLGYGCEGISDMMYAEYAISNPHNEVLAYAAFYGIPAAAAYVLGVLSMLTGSFRAASCNFALASKNAAVSSVPQNKGIASSYKNSSGPSVSKNKIVALASESTTCVSVPETAACFAAAGYFISSLAGVAMFYTLPFFFIFLGMSRRV